MRHGKYLIIKYTEFLAAFAARTSTNTYFATNTCYFFNLHTIIDRRFFHTKNTYIFPIYIRNIDRRFLTIQSTLLSTAYVDIITSESLCPCLEKKTKHLIFPRSLKFYVYVRSEKTIWTLKSVH